MKSLLRLHVFNKSQLVKEINGSDSWVDSNTLMHELEVANMKVRKIIKVVLSRDQWKNRIRI